MAKNKKLSPKTEGRIAGKLLRLALSEKNTSEIGQIMNDELPNMARKIHEKPGKVRAVLGAAVADVMTRRLGCRKLKIKW